LHELKKEGDKMKKLFYRLSSSRSLAKLFSKPMQPRLEERKTVMFCRKSFLVFLLAFAALTLGRSQEARACEPDDWWCLLWESPLLIDGGSKNLVYTCDEGQGTNRLILKPTPTLDQFISDGDVSCDFTGKVKGTAVQCSYHVEWAKDELATCVYNPTTNSAVVTVQSKCDNLNVSGTLSCPTLTLNGSPVLDLLGISSTSECQTLFGTDANTLFSQTTFQGKNCDVLGFATSSGLTLSGLTKTTTNLCHSDGTDTVDCIVGNSTNPNPNNSNKSNSAVPNLGVTACNASPTNWNVDCSGNKDKGDGTFCFLNGIGGVFSFDPSALNLATATLNGVPVDIKKGQPLCVVKDCNGDQIPDLQCSFPTCSGGQATAAPVGGTLGDLTGVISFNSTTDASGLTCTTHVGTSGQLP